MTMNPLLPRNGRAAMIVAALTLGLQAVPARAQLEGDRAIRSAPCPIRHWQRTARSGPQAIYGSISRPTW